LTFATYWLDPQGFKLEAVCHTPEESYPRIAVAAGSRASVRLAQPAGLGRGGSGGCEVVEGSVGGTRWRRLLQSATLDDNVGERALTIGRVDYSLSGHPAISTSTLGPGDPLVSAPTGLIAENREPVEAPL
jgi:hypothetical protein